MYSFLWRKISIWKIRNGIVMLGSWVEMGDILLGKLMPHMVFESSDAPEDGLLRATLGISQWDADSIEGSPDRSLSSRKIILPSPKNRVVTPLKKHEMKNIARRRIKKWSSLEEETLRIAVEKYGRGNWKLILNSYREIFEGRTEVDLKDKWRNMVR